MKFEPSTTLYVLILSLLVVRKLSIEKKWECEFKEHKLTSQVQELRKTT